jgi:hypothetical protein
MDEHDRLRRVRLVSERYHELQGLRAALIGSAFTLSMGLYLISTGWKDGVLDPVVALGFAFAIDIPGMLWLDRYYERTYGRVKAGAAAERLSTFVIPVSFFAATILDHWLLGGSYTGMFVVLGGFSLWVAIRDWPLRSYHLVGAIAGIAAGFVQLTDTARQAPDSALATGFLIVGIAQGLTGFADHRLLTRSFSLAHPEQLPEKLQPPNRI